MGMIRGRSVQTHGEIIPAQHGRHALSALNVPILIWRLRIYSSMHLLPSGSWRLSIKSALPHEPSGWSPRLCMAKPACAGYGGLFTQRPYALGYARRSPPARAMADYLLKDHTPSAMHGEARLRGLYWIVYSKTIYYLDC